MPKPNQDTQFEPVPESTTSLRQKLRQKRFGNKHPHRLRWILAGLAGGGVVLLGLAWLALEKSLPDASNLPAVTATRSGTITFTSADGFIISQTGPATRNPQKFSQIPDLVKEAFLATEDRRFYQHHGIDFQGVLRAITSNVMSGNVVEGGSTITQQLARITFLDQERTAIRKLREALLAEKIEQQLTKEQILERYLNQVYLGAGAYGAADAAWVYFGKSLQKLTLPEIATLAGLPAAPSLYSPLINPETARQRRNVVLERMHRSGFITAAQAEAASQAPLDVQPHSPANLNDKTPYFSAYIQKQLSKYVPAEQLKAGGLTVQTTLNLKWQESAEQAVKDAIDYDGPGQGFEQAALVSLDPRNGKIKTMVGGGGFDKSQFNRVTQAQRQPGSTFKAFVYTAAIAAGLSPYDGYLDAPLTVDGYQPKNYSKKHRGWVSMSEALTYSVNIVAVRALIEVGFDPVIKLAHAMGIQSELKPVYSMALGSNEVNLLELTSAYGSIASQGFHTSPYGIQQILDRQGKAIYSANYQKKRVLDPGTASIMTWMLENVVTRGTGTAAQIGRPVAGKTGTSEKARDLWFVGFIPQLVTGVWLGNDDNYPTSGSSSTAAYTWHEFMAPIAKTMPVEKFPSLPKIEGRKGSIKAKPIHPASMFTGSADDEADNSENSDSSYQENYQN
jgi:penicillin-binding protein 1A